MKIIIKKIFKKFISFFVLTGKNIASLHRKVWGKGWKRLILAIILSIIILIFIFSITLNVTSKPSFCSNCHYMEPYYESWKNSSHNNVTCTDCHFPPGLKSKLKGKFTALSMVVNYFTGVYKKSKPWAEISDKSCLRSGCHEKRLLNGKVKFKEGIIFDHSPHLNNLRRNKKLRCTSCHSQIVQGSHLSVTETSCFLCHFKGIKDKNDPIKKCTKCHTPPVKKTGENVSYDHSEILRKNISCYKCHGKMVVGDGAVPKNRCSNCHAELHKIELFLNTEFIHKNHITDHKIECNQCHTEIQHKSVSRTRSVEPDCNACHSDSHQVQLSMFTGTQGKGISDHPSLMFNAGLNCQACHVYHNINKDFKIGGDTLKASAKSCEPCHGKGYNKILSKWKRQTEKKIKKLSRILSIARSEISKIKNKEKRVKSNKIFSDALFNLDMVKYGKSIHNISYANLLLNKSYDLAVMSVRLSEKNVSLPIFGKEQNLIPGECSNCHKNVVKKNIKIFGLNFLHSKHLSHDDISCQKCHSNISKHGQLIVKKNDCMSCHHNKKTITKCSDCHKIQNNIFNGKIFGKNTKIPNIMKNDIECSDCHYDENLIIIRPGKKICSRCHEKDYEDMLDEWKNDTETALNKLKESIKNSKNKKHRLEMIRVLNYLHTDGSHGIHNPELYQYIIKETLKKNSKL